MLIALRILNVVNLFLLGFVIGMLCIIAVANAEGVNYAQRDYSFPTPFDTARYMVDDTDPSELSEIMSDSVISIGIDTIPVVRLADFIDEPDADSGTPMYLAQYNEIVNHAFDYRSDAFNFWYTENPTEALLLGSGDCKAYANFKYHLLKQLGYKNVKIISVVMADGTGDLGGHVVTLVNDIWVMDINYPYFYPFFYLRANNGVFKAFDEHGKQLVRRGWW